MALALETIKIEEGFDFILSHFEEPIWPRTIFTKTLGRQYTVYSREEAIARFKQSNLMDCRVNAYPDYIAYHGINRQPPNFIFIDIDRCLFKTDKEFWVAAEKTCKNIEQTLGAKPTMLCSGNGVHICQPVEAMVLEQESKFAKFDQPSQMFLKFAAQFLSNHKSDTNNNPVFKSCLLRIPGSYNSKYTIQNNEIKIIQRWDGFRPKINPLLYDYYIYLADRTLKELNAMSKAEGHHTFLGNIIKWIEKGILEYPLSDHRKYIIWRILSPYLLNVKKLPKEQAYSIMKEWLDKCDKLEKLSFNSKIKIKDGLKRASKGYFPISMEKLKEENRQLYDLVLDRIREQ